MAANFSSPKVPGCIYYKTLNEQANTIRSESETIGLEYVMSSLALMVNTDGTDTRTRYISLRIDRPIAPTHRLFVDALYTIRRVLHGRVSQRRRLKKGREALHVHFLFLPLPALPLNLSASPLAAFPAPSIAPSSTLCFCISAFKSSTTSLPIVVS
jgi:hypothetical protein